MSVVIVPLLMLASTQMVHSIFCSCSQIRPICASNYQTYYGECDMRCDILANPIVLYDLHKLYDGPCRITAPKGRGKSSYNIYRSPDLESSQDPEKHVMRQALHGFVPSDRPNKENHGKDLIGGNPEASYGAENSESSWSRSYIGQKLPKVKKWADRIVGVGDNLGAYSIGQKLPKVKKWADRIVGIGDNLGSSSIGQKLPKVKKWADRIVSVGDNLGASSIGHKLPKVKKWADRIVGVGENLGSSSIGQKLPKVKKWADRIVGVGDNLGSSSIGQKLPKVKKWANRIVGDNPEASYGLVSSENSQSSESRPSISQKLPKKVEKWVDHIVGDKPEASYGGGKQKTSGSKGESKYHYSNYYPYSGLGISPVRSQSNLLKHQVFQQ